MIKILSDYTEMDHTLDQLRLMPTPAMAVELGIVLNLAYATTQAQVHVMTGSLRMSGKQTSVATDGKWSGTINYGGASTGVINPVVYAYYEKRRGGEHDFIRGVGVVMDRVGTVMAEGLAKA